MKKYVLSAALSITLTYAFAQDDKIESDRPGETQTAEVVEKGYLQAEVGFRKQSENGDDKVYYHPLANLKYGLSKRFELRLQLAGETDKYYSKQEFEYGLDPVEVGFKAKLTEGKGILPTTSLYTQVSLPHVASKDHEAEHMLPKLRLLFENKLTEKLKLNYNAGAEWDRDTKHAQWLYTIAPEMEIGKNWEAFLEVFGFMQRGETAKHTLDGSIAFYAHNNIKLDVFGGVGLSKGAPDYFIATGVSFRLKP